MIHHHSSGKRRLLKRIFSMCIALILICGVSVPVLAVGADSAGGDTDQPEPSATYNFYVGGELYSSQTLTDGQTLKEPEAPQQEGSSFDGWYTEEEGGEHFTDFSPQTVTEDRTVNLYAVWTPVQEEDAEALADSDTPPDNEDGQEEMDVTEGNLPENGENSGTEGDGSSGDPKIPETEDNGRMQANEIELYADGELQPDENFIVVEKRFAGLTETEVDSLTDFSISVSSGSQSYTLTKNSEGWSQTADGNDIVWRWQITGVGTGTYQVTENGEELENYTVQTEGEGSVTVKSADMEVSVPKHETSCSTSNWSVGVEGDTNFLFAATLTGNNGTIVISGEPLSASQRATVRSAVLNISGPWKEPVYFYSLQDGTQFTIEGRTFTYNPENREIIIGNTSDWMHVATLTYSVTEASNPEIGITNTYTPDTQDIQVVKDVTGSMGDVQKEFAFTYSYTDSSGTQQLGNFTLKDTDTYPDSIGTIPNIPIGAVITLTETDAAGYDTTAEYGEDALEVTDSDSGKTITVTTVKGKTTIVVTNSKDVIPDTGIRLNTLPYVLMIIFAAAGAAVMFLRRRPGM